MKKLKDLSLVDIILVLSPILDVIICMLQKFTNVAILGTLMRGSLLLGLLIYIFFIKKEYDKRIIRYIIALFIYAYIFIFNLFLMNNSYIYDEIIGLIKYLFYPLMISALLIIKNKNKEKIYDSLYICGLIYAFFLLIPMLFNVNFNSYSSVKVGNVGWFYSANEISSIVSILCPFIIIKLYDSESLKNKIMHLIISIIYIYTIFTIGTKTVIVSTFLTLLFLLIKDIYNLIKKRDKISPLFTLILIGFTILCFSYSSSLQNIKMQNDLYDISDIAKRDSELVNDKEEIMSNDYKIMYDFRDEPMYITNRYLNLILSSRDVFLMEHINSYKNAGLQEELFGMGQIYNEKSSATSKLVEIDFFDIFFNYGIVGFIIYFSFIVYLLFLIIKYFFKNIKNILSNVKLFSLYISIFISIMLSCIAGHIAGAPSVSLIVAIIVMTLCDKVLENNYIKENIFTKKFILKIIAIIILFTFIVFGVNKISNKQTISNRVNVKISNHTLTIDDNNYQINKINEKEVVSDYATDKLTFYNVFYKRKSIIKLLIVDREFFDSDIKMKFIVGKNYTKNSILLSINSENNYSMDAHIYDLINVNYDGINHSIVKDLKSEVDLNNSKELLLGKEEYFDIFMINNDLKELNEFESDSWLSFDGRYSFVEEETIPKGNNKYARKCYNDIEAKILNNYTETNNEIMKAFVSSNIHSQINYLPRYDNGVCLSEYTNKELSAIGLKAFYVNFDDNIKLSYYLKNHEDLNVNIMGELFGKYLLNNENNIIIKLMDLEETTEDSKQVLIKDLIKTAVQYLKNNHYIIEGELLDKLKAGGYVG